MAELGTAIGLISLGMQIFKGLVSYYDSWNTCHKDIESTSKSIADLSQTLEGILAFQETQADKKDGAKDQVRSIITRCQASVSTLAKQLQKFESKSLDLRKGYLNFQQNNFFLMIGV